MWFCCLQAGLSGSSAIICAALSCLLDFYDVGHFVKVEDRPSIILSAEEEIGITAGLQDRVIQVYGGLVYMVCGIQSSLLWFDSFPLSFFNYLPSFFCIRISRRHIWRVKAMECTYQWMCHCFQIFTSFMPRIPVTLARHYLENFRLDYNALKYEDFWLKCMKYIFRFTALCANDG